MSILADVLEHLELTPTQLSAYIDEYKLIQPYDCKIDTARAMVELLDQNYEQAEKWILNALRKNPLAYQNHLYCALIYNMQGNYFGSAKECYIALYLARQSAVPSSQHDELQQIQGILDETTPRLSQTELREIDVQINILHSPGLLFPAYFLYRQNKCTVFQSEFLYFDSERPYNDFACIEAQSYISGINWAFQNIIAQSGIYDTYAFTPIEIWKARKTAQFDVNEAGQVFAVAATVPGQTLSILPAQGERVNIRLSEPYSYHYVNVDEVASLHSAQEFILSKGIPSAKNSGRKKQVLFINVNSLSHRCLTGTNFDTMPYTKAFFEKGIVFQNCYSTCESTYPSESSLLTGLYTTTIILFAVIMFANIQ